MILLETSQIIGSNEDGSDKVTPTFIDPRSIRSINPRKERQGGEPRTGTRFTFKDGRGFAVTDLYGDVTSRIAETAAGPFLTLTMVVGPADQPSEDDVYSDTDEPGEGNEPAPVTAGGERTTPVTIATDAVRCFYRRKDRRGGEPRIGTRLTFIDGGGFAVSETIDVVKEALETRPQ